MTTTMTKTKEMTLSEKVRRHVSMNGGKELDDASIGECLVFTDRAGYLTWVAEWKAAVNEQISGVRQARKSMHVPGGDSNAQSERAFLRKVGHNLYAIRRASKAKAGAQMAQAKAGA